MGVMQSGGTTPSIKNGWRNVLRLSQSACAGLVLLASLASAQDVLTQRNDAARTGAQLNETILTPANVTPTTFGRIAERFVDGQIITQPLYVSNLAIPGKGTKNVVYVATRKNLVYAFDADDTTADVNAGRIWSTPIQVEAAGPVPGMCPETVGPVGITSTPVIDRSTGTMYLVARRSDGGIFLHALNILTGAQAKAPVLITTPGFNQGLELNRAALLLQNGAVYLAFSALNCDNAQWHGWVFAYRTSDFAQIGVFNTSPNSSGAGIWQSGNGLVGDGNAIYFATGNIGSGNGAPGDLDMSFVKLQLGAAPGYGLSLAGHYTLTNRAALNAGDTDLSSGGPMLLPSNRLVGGGKQGKLYVLDAASMTAAQFPPASGAVPPGGSDGAQTFVNSWHNDATKPECTNASLLGRQCYMVPHRYEDSEMYGPNIHGGQVFWKNANPSFGLLYGMPEKDYLRSFRYDNSTHLFSGQYASGGVRSPDGMPGAALSLSANGSSNGIIWASVPKQDGQWHNVPGSLMAFNALTLAKIWSDDDDIGFPKFTPPTIAGGKVFRPTFANKLLIYGLKNGATALPCYTVAQKYQNYTGPEGWLGAATSGINTAADGIGQFQNYGIGSIYWTPTTCAWEVQGAIYAKWSQLGLERSVVGYPITDENGTPDGRGRYNHFQSGSIYYTPQTGANAIYGVIRATWSNMGWENSSLGYPLTDETEEIDGSGRFNVFEHGTIHFKSSNGAITLPPTNSVNMLMSAPRAGTDRPGSDIASFQLPANSTAQCMQACTDNASCVSWTLVKPGVQAANAICYLKNAAPLQVANSCCTSGIKVQVNPPGMTAMQGRKDLPGADMPGGNFDLPAADPLLCQGECALNGSCKAWTYTDNANPHCFLKTSVPSITDHPNAISGHK